MVKNYASTFLHSWIIVALFGFVAIGQGQEPRIFTISDFDLKGPVKSCLVSTKYGKEAYDFDKQGKLTKSVTRYNESDYDVTYYKYKGGELAEKRFENYRNNVFERSTSYANFYEVDTVPERRVTEKIISYDKEFLDRYEYIYNADTILTKIIRTNNDGNDETLIDYSEYRGEQTQIHELNGSVIKSIRKSVKVGKNKQKQRVILTKKFLEGEPQSALEEVFDEQGKLLSETHFVNDPNKNQFAPKEVITYEYDSKGMLLKSITKRGKSVAVKEYIYQFDNGEEGNWIKEIITPENSYTTRKIKYYEDEVTEKKEE
ncbi:hypothetical protein [Maribacter luteus]|uniref:Sugar-binding protein n=1 Tax=Maribacter luteus TaxID=2594478 RepID=A0A6I2MPA9_9FLAO|nr:hypothetical protein [Maribacter luteus]MRX64589.1 hypothetical protein [Maribacter luteus]